MQENSRKKRAKITTLAAAVVVLGLYGGVVAYTRPKNEREVIQISPPPPAISQPAPPRSETSYRDGTYSATGKYTIPVGEENVVLDVTITNDVVTAVTVKFSPKVSTSEFYQAQFQGGYKQFVVGKKLDEIQVTKVSGSSLSSKGFHDALNKIKAQAKL